MSESQSARIGSAVTVQKYLKGLKYPSNKQGLVQHAQEHGAPEEMVKLMNKLPDREYKGPPDVSKAIAEISR